VLRKILILSVICFFSNESYSLDLESIQNWDKTIRIDNNHIIDSIYDNGLDLFTDFDGGDCDAEFEDFYFEEKRISHHSNSETEVRVSFSYLTRRRSFTCRFESYNPRCNAYLLIKDDKLIKTDVLCF
jgi:hypothetical protein